MEDALPWGGSFRARLWRWTPEGESAPASGAWWFVSVPEACAPPLAGAWGRAPVRASVGGRSWDTSAWRDRRHGWVLAVPVKLRRGFAEGAEVEVSLAPALTRA